MNPFEMVVLIVAMVMIATVLKSRYRTQREAPPQDSLEAQQLREEVKQLKERIQVLERITIEKENSLARQIEELRDR